jgi:The Golgi pH Regulator (GPHR) Family N-terminal
MNPDLTTFIARIAIVGVASIGALSGIGIAIHAYMQYAKRKMGKQVSVAAGADDDRLRRLENAVDSIAIEVERISEGQRFLTKLQTARPEDRVLIE